MYFEGLQNAKQRTIFVNGRQLNPLIRMYDRPADGARKFSCLACGDEIVVRLGAAVLFEKSGWHKCGPDGGLPIRGSLWRVGEYID